MSVMLAAILLGAPAQDPVGLEKLAFKIEAAKSAVLELEPVRLLMSAENVSGAPVNGIASAFAVGLDVQVAGEAGDFATIRPPWKPQGLPMAVPGLSLAYGYKGRAAVTVSSDTLDAEGRELRVFPEPGKYRLRARIWLGSREVISNVVEVAVVRPQVPADAAVAEALKGADLDVFLSVDAARADVKPEQILQVEGVCRRFPGSSYEPWLTVGIAAVQFARSTPEGNPKGGFNEAGLKRVIALCGPVAARENHPAAPDAAFLAGRACALLKRTAKARAYLNQALATGLENYAVEGAKALEAVKLLEESGIKAEE